MWQSIPQLAFAVESRDLGLVSSWRSNPLALRPILRSFTVNGKRMRVRSFLLGWRKGTLPPHLYGAISQPSAMANAANSWIEQDRSISSLEESPVSPGRWPETEKERQISATFGRTFGPLWSSKLLIPCSWKTSQDSLFGTAARARLESYARDPQCCRSKAQIERDQLIVATAKEVTVK